MRRAVLVALLVVFHSGCNPRKTLEKAPPPPKKTGARVAPAMNTSARATALAKKLILVDGHIDVPHRLRSSSKDGALTEDVSARTKDGQFDYPRAVQGGLDAPFMSIYVPAEYQQRGGARKLADELIDLVEGIAKAHPDKFAIARAPKDVRANFAAGVISLPLGIENGAALEHDVANVAHFYDRGVRYVTLTHSKDNAICDSSYDDAHTWRGLSPFGRKVIAELNRVGIMIDVSHVSDDTFFQVLDVTKTPVIASHSSARSFTPGFERNMSDEMLQKLAANGGVVMVNFGSMFLTAKSHAYFEQRHQAAKAYAGEHDLADDSPEMEAWSKSYTAEHPRVLATVSDVADHIDHIVEVAGIDHVGLGSDFDGVGGALPTGLEDVSMYPNLIGELLERGYSEAKLEKLCSGNLLRVWQAVADYAASQR